MNNQHDYDLEAVYDEEISPLMAEIIAICQRRNLPMLASFAYARNEEMASFCTTALLFPDRTPDQFRDALKDIKP